MNVYLDPLQTLYIVSALALVAIAIVVYPSLKSKKK
jgi:hypothetical protein